MIWDLALLQAILRPELATSASAATPPDNTRREVSVYTGIDAQRMRADFYRALESHVASRARR